MRSNFYIIRHAVPGRLRLQIPAAERSVEAMHVLTAMLSELTGVARVRANKACASVVVEYDPARPEAIHAFCGQLAETPLFSVNGWHSNTLQKRAGMAITRRSATRTIAGKSLLAIGVIGWLLPIVPGTPFVIAGAALLGKEDPVVRFGTRMLVRVTGKLARRG